MVKPVAARSMDSIIDDYRVTSKSCPGGCDRGMVDAAGMGRVRDAQLLMSGALNPPARSSNLQPTKVSRPTETVPHWTTFVG